MAATWAASPAGLIGQNVNSALTPRSRSAAEIELARSFPVFARAPAATGRRGVYKLSFTPKLAVVLLELLTPQTILRQVIAGRTVLWEASKPPTRRMTMLRVLTRAGPTCLRHTVPTPAGTGAGLQEGKHRSIRPCVGPKVHTGTALPSGNSWSRVGWRWRVKPPNAVTVAGGYAIAVRLTS